jgi:lauroyl/myristoyl acyltransferase
MLQSSVQEDEKLGAKAYDDEAGCDATSFVAWRDVALLAMLVTLALGCWILPSSRWPTWAEWVARWRLALSEALSPDELDTIGVVVGDRSTDWIESSFRPSWLAHKYHGWMMMLACSWPRRWQPTPRLVGEEHLKTALASGRGAIIFTATFAYNDLMTKAALARAGYQVSHVSMTTHGFTGEGPLARFLNLIYTRAEMRFLRERMVFHGMDTKEINARIRARLRDNATVMVTVTPLGRRTSVRPCLHGRVRIATGGLSHGCETGTVVLPTFTTQKPDGQIETIIEPPLDMPTGLPKSDAIERMVSDYVPRLEAHIAEHPEQFCFAASRRHGQLFIEP